MLPHFPYGQGSAGLAWFAASLLAAAPAVAQQASAQASATVMEPLAVSADTALSFGRFARGDSAGSVTVSTAGTVSGAGGVSNISAPGAAASFTITGEPGATFQLSSTTVALTDGKGNSMPLDLIGDFDGAGKVVPGIPSTGVLAGGTQTLHLGGKLGVAAGQPAGAYSAQVGITVSYQ